MKFDTTVRELRDTVAIAGEAVAKRSTLPVLHNVLLQAYPDGRVRITGSNLEQTIAVWFTARVEQEGAVTVPFKTFSDLLNTLPDKAQTALSASADTLTLSTEKDGAESKRRTRNNIKGIAAEEFPLIQDYLDHEAVHMEVSDFREIAGQVLVAASTNPAHPVLNGVYTVVADGVFSMKAADNFQLATRSLPAPTASDIQMIVPAGAISSLLKRLPAEGTLVIGLSPAKNLGIFICDSITLSTQLIEGNYPDLDAIMQRADPKAAKKKGVVATVETADLIQALKTTDVFAREAAHTAIFKFGEDGIEIKGTSAETGDSSVSVPAKVKGKMDIAINTKFVLDYARVAGSQLTKIHLLSPTSLARFEPDEEGGLLYAVMPMHLGK